MHDTVQQRQKYQKDHPERKRRTAGITPDSLTVWDLVRRNVQARSGCALSLELLAEEVEVGLLQHEKLG
jgi:hypothetical protein